MKLGEYSFREVADRYLLFTDPSLTAMAAKSFLMEEPANALLAYCYISHSQGLSLELLCFVQMQGDCPIFYPTIEAEPPMQMDYAALENSPVTPLDEQKLDLSPFHQPRRRLKEAEQTVLPQLLPTRELRELDPLRAERFPDDIRVILTKEGLQPEGNWLRLERLTPEGKVEGDLLLAPLQDFGVTTGSTVQGVLTKQEEWYCVVPL